MASSAIGENCIYRCSIFHPRIIPKVGGVLGEVEYDRELGDQQANLQLVEVAVEVVTRTRTWTFNDVKVRLNKICGCCFDCLH